MIRFYFATQIFNTLVGIYISILSLGFLAMILEEEFFGEAVA